MINDSFSQFLMFFNNGFWFYSMMGGWSTWQWVFLNFPINFWSFDTHDTPGCASAVFAENQSENEIWNRLKQFLPVCPGTTGSGIPAMHNWNQHFEKPLENHLRKKHKLLYCVTSCQGILGCEFFTYHYGLSFKIWQKKYPIDCLFSNVKPKRFKSFNQIFSG